MGIFSLFKKKATQYNSLTREYTPSSLLTWDEFKECLINPLFRPEVAWRYQNLPISIDAGPLGKTSDTLLKETINDPYNRERGTYVKVDLSDKLLLQKAEFATVGNEYAVSIQQQIEGFYAFNFGTITEKIAAILHTHPRNLSQNPDLIHIPSPLDISNLFTDELNKCSISLINTPSSVPASKGLHWMLIRTSDTVSKTDEKSNAWIHKLNYQLQQTYQTYSHTVEQLTQSSIKLIQEACHKEKIGVYFFDISKNVFLKQ